MPKFKIFMSIHLKARIEKVFNTTIDLNLWDECSLRLVMDHDTKVNIATGFHTFVTYGNDLNTSKPNHLLTHGTLQ